MAGSQMNFRFERKGGFTVLTNGVLRDPRLSLKTKGLFAVISSLPEDWRYSVSGLASYCGVGRDAIRSALKELEAAGYLTREQLHGERGKFGGNAYVLREESVLPLPGFPSTGNPSTGNPTLQKKDKQKKEKTNTPIVPQRGDGEPGKRKGRTYKPEPDWKPERFAKFWEFYPRGENKQAAIRAWDKLRAEDSLIDTMAAALVRQKKRADWQQGVGIPYASTWLNGRRWEDEERAPDTAQPEAPQPRKYHMAVIDGEEVVVYDD
ncbi:helix-turn-helix domain-containing protein [Clostridium sp. J1101437_171009_A5]|uniref:helix-turn-helix domain-containing protein n=1 Tax=Clostridium sp. J1101437_171009_A5 TaxID=2787098 RepID=UPI00189AC4F7